MEHILAFDELDTRPDSEREASLFDGFRERLLTIAERVPALARQIGNREALPESIDREALAALPVLRKHELMAAQQAAPPFGGHVDEAALAGQRLFVSPGPVWEPQLPMHDPWQGARALHAAGVRPGDRVHNAFAYHMTPGGFILDEAARALGCVVFPAGTGNTEAQLAALAGTAARVYTGTPDYLQTLLVAADDKGQNVDHLQRALVSGGALFPAMREAWRARGIHALQCYATADLGVVAYEVTDEQGELVPGMVVNEGLIVEILVPGSGRPVAPGEVGEVVVTRLDPVYPLLRFATGDLSASIEETLPEGRTARRIRGWLGRADQRTKVRGMFVDPEQVEALRSAVDGVEKLRLVVARDGDRDVMTLRVLASAEAARPDEASLAARMKSLFGLSGLVEVVDSLPDDGIVIEDARDYEAPA
ncbi:MAG: AMP-dependent synthetase [Gammaproteobacteria bacterium]|nr:MAG: AMP-dependent synthetase [Gammaproteobacteria bacterium]